MKQSSIKLNETQLKKIVAESVKRVLKEVYMDNGGDLMGMYDGEEGPTNEPDYEETDNNKKYALQIDLVYTYLQKATNCLKKAFAYNSQPSENALKAKKAIEVANNAIGNIIYNNFKS